MVALRQDKVLVEGVRRWHSRYLPEGAAGSLSVPLWGERVAGQGAADTLIGGAESRRQRAEHHHTVYR